MAQTLVSTAHFVGEILVVSGTNPHTGAGFELCDLIEKYEPIYLGKALGYEFYKDVLANVLPDPENVPEKYADLINGADYTFNGRLYQWEGLVKHTAQHIYYWYRRNLWTSTTILGEATPNVENGAMRSDASKMVKAFNDSIEGAYNLRQYLSTKREDFPLYNPAYVDHCYFRGINTFGI